jgi:hypothetical protein
MVRFIRLLLPLALAGCVSPWEAAWNQGGPKAAQYDFDWRLSGEPSVAPLQVFGSASQIWLQFAPGQEVPAIFAGTPEGDVPLRYRRQDPYVVIDGAWQALAFRGGRHAARAVHGAREVSPPPEPSRSEPLRHLPLTEALAARAGAIPGKAQEAARAPKAAPPAGLHAGPPESTLRAVLAKWARASGWTFDPQHWAVDVDIPLAGSAAFSGDFREAVRGLLASTELSERPVQPCFYANKVLRVVPYAQACDRSAVPEGGNAS